MATRSGRAPNPARPAARPKKSEPAEQAALGNRGARTRRRLLEAAEEVFTALSYHDASIVKITEAAGVAQGTFYLYFSSKQAIFEELVDDLNARVRRAMTEAAATATERIDAERRGFEAFFRFTAEHPGLYRVIRQAEFVSPASLHRHYQRISEGYVGALKAAMHKGEIAEADPDVVAWCLMGVGELVGMRWILWDDGRKMPRAVFDQMMGFIARGLGGQSR